MDKKGMRRRKKRRGRRRRGGRGEGGRGEGGIGGGEEEEELVGALSPVNPKGIYQG